MLVALFRCPQGVCNAYIAQVSAEEDTDCWEMFICGPQFINAADLNFETPRLRHFLIESKKSHRIKKTWGHHSLDNSCFSVWLNSTGAGKTVDTQMIAN